MSQRAELRLSDFDISEKTGFLPENPLKRLPGDYFKEWEDLVEQLPLLLRNKQVRETIDRLDDVKFDETTLQSQNEWQRAYLLLTLLGQAYIWMEGDPDKPLKLVPPKIAVPWNYVSVHIGVPPVLTYAAVVLYNYRFRDSGKPLELDNLQAISTFLDDPGESWFYMVQAYEEFVAVPGLRAIEHAYSAMAVQDNDGLAQDLQQIATTLKKMEKVLNRMKEHCKPDFFFNTLRPYQAGSIGIGITYEGVDSTPQYLRGGTGAEDSAIPAFDIFLGVTHSEKQQAELDAFKKYMPKKHREFLTELSHQPSVNKYTNSSGNAKVIKSYNEAVDALGSFRKRHVALVHYYIIQFKPQAMGLGGATIKKFLGQLCEDTNQKRIPITMPSSD